MENEVEHLRERERHHDEIDSLRAHHEYPDNERREPGCQHGRRERQPEVRRIVFRRHEPQRVGADPEERRVAERYEPRIADEHVEAHRENRQKHHLGDELGVERRAGEREQREQRERPGERNPLPAHRLAPATC